MAALAAVAVNPARAESTVGTMHVSVTVEPSCGVAAAFTEAKQGAQESRIACNAEVPLAVTVVAPREAASRIQPAAFDLRTSAATPRVIQIDF